MKTQIITLLACLMLYTASAQFPATQKVNVPRLTVQLQDDVFQLQWSVFKEINTSYFVVEQSLDGGKTFTAIATVKAGGYASFSTHYTYELQLPDTTAAYRVSLVLMEGLRISSNLTSLKEQGHIILQQPLAKK